MGSKKENSVRNSQYWLKMLVFIFLVFISDLVIGALLKHFYFTQSSGFQYRNTYSIDSTRANLLVFGASTANHHYVPQVFEDTLHLSYYNTGRDGSGIFYHYAILKSVLKRYKPKVILLDIHPDVFAVDRQDYERLSELLPYYHSHPEIREILLLRSRLERITMLSRIYPYNSMLLSIIVGNMEFNKKRKDDDRGYMPLYGSMKNMMLDSLLAGRNFELDTNKINTYIDFISECRENNVPLFVLRSPKYYVIDNPSVKEIQRINDELEIPYLDYSFDDDYIEHPEYFVDNAHLNHTGAVAYSAEVAKQIKMKLFHPESVQHIGFSE